MPQDQLKKELYQLMAGSLTIQMLPLEKRVETQDHILSLPEAEMRSMIDIFRREQMDMSEMNRQSVRERKEIKKIGSLVDRLRDAGKMLDKAFLTARESEERDESSRITTGLLDQIDSL